MIDNKHEVYFEQASRVLPQSSPSLAGAGRFLVLYTTIALYTFCVFTCFRVACTVAWSWSSGSGCFTPSIIWAWRGGRVPAPAVLVACGLCGGLWRGLSGGPLRNFVTQGLLPSVAVAVRSAGMWCSVLRTFD